MLSKCLNPTCSAIFRYLSDGRVFHLEIPRLGDKASSRRREYFWLCERCCASYTVVVKDGVASLRSRLLQQFMPEKRLESTEGEKRGFFRQADPGLLGP